MGAREERLAEPPGADAGRAGDEQPGRGDPRVVEPQPEPRPRRAAAMCCMSSADRRDQPGDEPAPGRVVAAQEDVDRDDERERQQPARGDRERSGDAAAHPRRGSRRAHAVQQRGDAERRDARAP